MIVANLLLIAFFLVGVWYVIGVGLARTGGWTALARCYRASGAPDGRTFRMQSVRFGWADYNGGVALTVASEGLYLAVRPILLFAHPPILIPWGELQVLQITDTRWSKYLTVSVGKPPIARLRLPLRIAAAAQELLPFNGEQTR